MKDVLRIVAAVAAVSLAPAVAQAQYLTPCSTCETCTTALAAENAGVELSADLDATRAATCVRITGRGATFDGKQHTIRGAGVAVEVAGDDIVVRNVQTQEGGTAFRLLRAHDVTLYDDTAVDARIGLRVEASEGVRVQRGHFTRDRVGISFGASDAGACAGPAELASRGVVVLRSQFLGGGVGVAACDAMPLLIENAFGDLDRAAVLGDVTASGIGAASGPWDPCICAPSIAGLQPGTLMFYSSGCGGCTVHEGWLGDERARGAVIRARSGGADAGADQARFDTYVRHCGPEIMDALGNPGCVPNYSCPVTGETAKRRATGRELAYEHSISTPDDVVAVSAACRAAAHDAYTTGARCVTAALRGNAFCGSRVRDLTVAGDPSRWGAVDNRCGASSDGAAHTLCARDCNGYVPPTPQTVAPSTPDFPPSQPVQPPPAPAPTPTSAAMDPVEHGPVAPSGDPLRPGRPTSRGVAVITALAALIGLAVWRPWEKPKA